MIPENHILRLINKYIDFSFIRKKTKHLYSSTGRPSIDPEVLIKMLLVGYLYGITSERRLCEEVNMHIGYRWFVGLGLDDKVPDHFTFSKNRHARFKQSGIFQDIFDEIIKQCMDRGLVSAKHLSVDGSLIKANASIVSMEPVVVKMSTTEYTDTLELENQTEVIEDDNSSINKDNANTDTIKRSSHNKGYGKLKGKKIGNKTHRSKTDPDARLARKSHTQTTLSHLDNYLMDNKNRIILGVCADIPGKKSETSPAFSLIREFMFKFRIRPETVGADKGYSSGEFIHNLFQLGITPHIPTVDARKINEKGIFPIEQFRFDRQNNSFICPNGKMLKYHGRHYNQFVYRAELKECKVCPYKQECTKDRARSLSISIYEYDIQRVRKLAKTKAYRISIKKRKTIESLLGETKEQMGLRMCKFRRRWNVEEQFLLTATIQNIKRMVNLLNKKPKKADTVAKEKQDTLPIRQYGFLLFVKQLLTKTQADVKASALVVFSFTNENAFI